jgi:dTDP-glucose 4,6-dehydratase
VTGTFALLEAARQAWKGRRDVRFHHVSTDEVFGTLGAEGQFSEETPYDPSSPYSASKPRRTTSSAPGIAPTTCRVTLSNCSNNYGPHQYPEKLIPSWSGTRLRESRCRSTATAATCAIGSTSTTTAARST